MAWFDLVWKMKLPGLVQKFFKRVKWFDLKTIQKPSKLNRNHPYSKRQQQVWARIMQIAKQD